MSRKRKDYSVTTTVSPVRLTSRPSLTVDFKDERGRVVQSFEFSEFKKRRLLAAKFAEAFWEVYSVRRPRTRESSFHRIRNWFRFLEEHSKRVTNLEGLSTELVEAYILWLKSKKWAQKSRHVEYHVIKQLLRWLRSRYDLKGLDLPKAVFPGVARSNQPPKHLNKTELASVLRAAYAEIKEVYEIYQEGQRALADYVLPADGKPDLRELGGLLTFIMSEFKGMIPPITSLSNNIRFPLQYRGGIQRVCRYLHATNRSLLPYKIVIAAQTFANADSLHQFKRDCASAHPLIKTRTIVSWEKGRSNRLQRRSFDNRKSKSIPQLIDQVLTLTEPLLPYTQPSERQYLFLSRNFMGRKPGQPLVGLASPAVATEIKAFCKRHDLRDRHGKPLYFNLAMLRPTGLAIAHRSLGRDVRATRRLGNHVSLRNTITYVETPEVEDENNLHISKLQAKWVTYISSAGTTTELQEQLGVDEHNASEILEGRNATSSGFVCKDPFEGVAPGQRKGHLCTLWLGCFVCPNAVIPMEPIYLARVFQVRQALLVARQKMPLNRWKLLYAPILGIIERDIIPKFTDMIVVSQAHELATSLPLLFDPESLYTN